MKIYNILIFPGGTEIGLEIYKALYQCKDVKLFSVGENFNNHAPYVFKNYTIVDSVYTSTWIQQLNDVIDLYKIDYIFPAHDDVIIALSKNCSKINAKFITSPIETCLITRSKSRTYDFFHDIVPTPTMYKDLNIITKFPVFVKPDVGQGSQDTHICHNKQELSCVLSNNEDYIVLEYLPGLEYTIDCFSDRECGLLFCKGRLRSRIRNGITMNCIVNDNPIFIEYATKISNKLLLYGAWFFQLKQDFDGVFKLLEIAPRIAGTMTLNRVLGVNFSLLSLYEQERLPINILTNKIDIILDRALTNHYKCDIQYDCVYVDLDDTLILNNGINLNLIKFLYQCVNKEKRLILITKHNYNLTKILMKYRIENLFDEIIWVKEDENKVDYMNESNAIFIDDSFSERYNVHEVKQIMTFDCSMIEILMEELF